MAQNKNVQKIIIVGEPQSGKTAVIQSFLSYEGKLNESMVQNSNPHMQINSNSDFSLKIIKIEGEKVRL